MEIIWVDEATSTNSLCASLESVPSEGAIYAARKQSAGRGQRGNSWEAEPGANLTFSAFWRPSGVAPIQQFAISEAVALAVVEFLSACGVESKIKWPNDIYIGERKIAGILIEHSIMGSEITRTIAGVGININQTEFLSDAPNPVSLAQITANHYDLERMLEDFSVVLEREIAELSVPNGKELLHHRFLNALWRFDGSPFPFRHPGDATIWQGVIENVAPSGVLTIRNCESGECRDYHFKEVEFVVGDN